MLGKPEIKKEEKTEKYFTSFELDMAERAINDAGSEEIWLLDKGAITLSEDGQIVVKVLPDGSIPYKDLRALSEAVNTRIRHRQYGKDKGIFETTGQWPINPRIAKIREITKNIKTL